MNENNKQYYLNQINKLKDLTSINIQLVDFEGNKTHNMTINNDSIDVLIEFLNSLKESESK